MSKRFEGRVVVAPYVASKHAVIGLTKSAAIGHGPRGPWPEQVRSLPLPSFGPAEEPGNSRGAE